LGTDWARGVITPAPEHLLSNVIRGRLSALLEARAPPPPPPPPGGGESGCKEGPLGLQMGWAGGRVVSEIGITIRVVGGARLHGSNRLVAAANDMAHAVSGSPDHLDS